MLYLYGKVGKGEGGTYMTRTHTLLCAVALFTLSAIPAIAHPRIVMVTEAWPPFRIEDESAPQKFSGIDIDIMRLVAAELGIEVEIQRHPWGRSLEMLKNGQVDMITGVAFSKERTEFLAYVSTPYASVQPVFYIRKGSAASVKSYNDLYGKSIGQSTSSIYFQPYDTDVKLNKVNLSTEEQIIRMLALGRIDLAIGTDPNLAWDIARLGLRDAVEHTSYVPPVKTDLYIAFSKKSSAIELLSAIDAVITKMKAAGTIDAIIAKYR